MPLPLTCLLLQLVLHTFAASRLLLLQFNCCCWHSCFLLCDGILLNENLLNAGEIKSNVGRTGLVGFLPKAPSFLNGAAARLTGLSMEHSEALQVISHLIEQ